MLWVVGVLLGRFQKNRNRIKTSHASIRHISSLTSPQTASATDMVMGCKLEQRLLVCGMLLPTEYGGALFMALIKFKVAPDLVKDPVEHAALDLENVGAMEGLKADTYPGRTSPRRIGKAMSCSETLSLNKSLARPSSLFRVSFDWST